VTTMPAKKNGAAIINASSPHTTIIVAETT
jgi:hypothetical protein